MKAIELRDRFDLDALTMVERPDPEPGPGQVLLRMRAASLNARDLLTVAGSYNPKQPLPLIPCSDGVGDVVAVGDGVSRVGAGDRVAPIFAQKWLDGEPDRDKLRSTLGGPLDGTLAELMVVDADGVVAVPDHLSDEEAACLPCAGLTAWSALVTLGSLEPGDVVLTLGTGGVSIFALQFATAMRAKVIVTSSSDEKLDRATAMGASHVVNYAEDPKWGRTAKTLAGGDGVDHVIEVGGAGTLEQSLWAVRPGGRISMIGVLSGGESSLRLYPIFMRQITVQGVMVGHRAGFEAMNRAIAEHELRPVVDRVFPLSETRQALEHLAGGSHFGKVCIRIQE